MFCQYGAETIDAPPNALASHSYSFIYDPFTHTGLMGTLQLTPAWSVQLGVIMGPDNAAWILYGYTLAGGHAHAVHGSTALDEFVAVAETLCRMFRPYPAAPEETP